MLFLITERGSIGDDWCYITLFEKKKEAVEFFNNRIKKLKEEFNLLDSSNKNKAKIRFKKNEWFYFENVELGYGYVEFTLTTVSLKETTCLF